MRVQLEKINEIRQIFYGTFVRFGFKKHHAKTVLLANILDTSGKMMSDHVWFNYTKGFQEIEPLVRGDKIRFCARVKQYRKGSIRRGIPVEYDYRLSHPSKMKKIKKSIKTTPDVKIKDTLEKISKVNFIEQAFDLDKFNYKMIMEENLMEENLMEENLMEENLMEENLIEDIIEDELESEREDEIESDREDLNSEELSESELVEYEDGEEKLIMDHINLAKIEETKKIDPIENFIKKFNCIPEKKKNAENDLYMKLIEEKLEEKFTSNEDKIPRDSNQIREIQLEPELPPPPILYYGYTLKQSSIQNFVKGQKLDLLHVNKPRKQQVQRKLEYYF